MTSPVDYLSNPTHNVPTYPWRPNATDDEKVTWLVQAKADAVRQGMKIGKVAWLYRIMFGEFPSSRVAKRASQIRKAAERT